MPISPLMFQRAIYLARVDHINARKELEQKYSPLPFKDQLYYGRGIEWHLFGSTWVFHVATCYIHEPTKRISFVEDMACKGLTFQECVRKYRSWIHYEAPCLETRSP